MLADLFRNVITNYSKQTESDFSSNKFTKIVTSDLPVALSNSINSKNLYQIKGSVGQGNWAETPWIAFLDTRITSSTQNGYYVCYLVNHKKKTMFLSLMVGWTQFETEYQSRVAKRLIAEYGNYLCSQLRGIPQGFTEGPIDLSAEYQLSKGYEFGQILSKKYQLPELEDELITTDLQRILKSYNELTELVGSSITNIDYSKVAKKEKIDTIEREISKITLIADPQKALIALDNFITKTAPQKRTTVIKKAVRNPRIAQLVKESKGYICEFCRRKPFIQKNGQPYAEADHVTPLGGVTQGNDSPDNMRCLCAQCHAIVTHGSGFEIRKLLS